MALTKTRRQHDSRCDSERLIVPKTPYDSPRLHLNRQSQQVPTPEAMGNVNLVYVTNAILPLGIHYSQLLAVDFFFTPLFFFSDERRIIPWRHAHIRTRTHTYTRIGRTEDSL